MDDPAKTFRDYVTSSAFVLTLTRRQMVGLSHIYHNDGPAYRMDRLSVATSRSLEARGLIVWRGDEEPPKSWLKTHPSSRFWGQWTAPTPAYWDSRPFNECYCLTEAGIRVCELMIIAGLLRPSDQPVPVFGRKRKMRLEAVNIQREGVIHG